jgi:hypothetical protein
MKCNPSWNSKQIGWECNTCKIKMKNVIEIKECSNRDKAALDFLRGFGK